MYTKDSPGIKGKQLDLVMQERQSEQKVRSRAKIKLEKLSSGDGGDELNIDPDKFDASSLFDDELRKKDNGKVFYGL